MKVNVSYSGNSWFVMVWVFRPRAGAWALGGVRQFVCKPTRRQVRDANRDARKAYQRGREVMRGRRITHCYIDEMKPE